MTAIDLSRLPAPEVVEVPDYEAILAQMKGDLIARAPDLADVLELESEPLVKLLEVCAFRELLLRARINDAARAVMLASATGADLEHLGALFAIARLDGESDDALRARIQMAPEGFSVAGPVGAYRAHAMAAHAQVKDVSVASPAPGQVEITVLGHAGDGTPAPEVLSAVNDALNSDVVRPLTDQVMVMPAQIVTWSLTATLTLAPGPDAGSVLTAARAAAEAYVAERHALGSRISLSGLYGALHRPGVEQVTLIQPAADIVPGPGAAAFCSAIDIQEVAA